MVPNAEGLRRLSRPRRKFLDAPEALEERKGSFDSAERFKTESCSAQDDISWA